MPYFPPATGGGSGLGDVVGPASSTDNAIVRFDSTTGKLIQNSTVTIDDTGNVTLPSTKQIVLTDNQPASGTIAKLIKFVMTTANDRPWVAWYDESSRLRSALGYHSTNYSDGLSHNRFEIKTSVDPVSPDATEFGADPAFMKTAFYISTDANNSDVALGYLNRLYLDKQIYAASGQWGLTWRGNDSGSTLRSIGTALASLDASDNTILQFDPLTASGTKTADFRIFRSTNTVGTKTFKIYKGDNTTTVTFSINADTGAITAAGAATFSGDVTVPDEAYDATAWNGSLEVPTKNAVRDKIESMSAGGGITRTVTVTSGSFTAGSSASTDYVYLHAGAHNATLPTAASNSNRYTFKNKHSAAVTVTRAGTDTIEGATSITIQPNASVDLISDATSAWSVI